MSVERELPRYKSHKEVWALKIKELQHILPTIDGAESDGSYDIIPEDEGYSSIRVDYTYMRKHNPQIGGYYVVYKDGYKSWSPAEAFDDGYTKVS